MAEVLSIRNKPNFAEQAIAYIQAKWATSETMALYRDAISQSLNASNPLPQWYLLQHECTSIGCAGLITNDFISRGELYPWLCSLYIEPKFRMQRHATQLIQHVIQDTKALGFHSLHLCTDLEGFYEHFGFKYDGLGYHLSGESSRVYSLCLDSLS